MMDSPAFYERAALNVETYDLRTGPAEARQIAGDVAFYERLAERTGGPVLDLGAGTGRVTWPLADAGFDVVSLDLSEAMQQLAREKGAEHPESVPRVRFVRGDMNTFDLPEQFGLAVIPFRSFQALLEPQAQRSCLESIGRHLRPGGLLAFHVFDPLLQYMTPDAGIGPNPDRGTVVHPKTGNTVRITVLERSNDPTRQVMQELWEFLEIDESGAAVRRELERLTMRWTYRQEMRYLFELTGFEVEAESSDFEGSPPAYGKEQIYVARRGH